LKKQAEDIDLLVERMDSQVKELAKAYRRELEEIEVGQWVLIILKRHSFFLPDYETVLF